MSEKQNQENPMERPDESRRITQALHLGDIINLTCESSEDGILNGIFLIQYISPYKIKLFNDKVKTIERKIKDSVILDDEDNIITITKIDLLYRNPLDGYVKQNKLKVNTWLIIEFRHYIHFTCKITEIREDMIVLLEHTLKRTFYINFNYYGLPDELGITKITIIPPQKEDKPRSASEEGQEIEEELEEIGDPFEALGRAIEDANRTNNVREYVFYEEIDINRRRFAIELQTDDLFNNLLLAMKQANHGFSSFDEVIATNDCHILVERFLQLREQFSHKDLRVLEGNKTPLKQYFDKFETALHWIIPVVTNKKEIIDDFYKENEEEHADEEVIIFNENDHMEKLMDDIRMTKDVDYKQYLIQISEAITPFKNNESNNESYNDKLIVTKNVNTNITTIVNSFDDDDFQSWALEGEVLHQVKFSLLKYNIGLPYLEPMASGVVLRRKDKAKLTFFERKQQYLEPDKMQIMSFLILPESVIRFSRVNLPSSTILIKSNLSLNYLSYFELLNDTTTVENTKVQNVQNVNVIGEIERKKVIKNYMLIKNEDIDENKAAYDSCIKKLVPSVKELFMKMKRYINGKLSLIDVVSYLEPFLVYTTNIHFLVYSEIIKFIADSIQLYRNNYELKKKIFSSLENQANDAVKLCHTEISLMMMLTLFDISVKQSLIDGYNFTNEEDNNTQKDSNSEVLRKLILMDYANLFCSAISKENILVLSYEEQANEDASKVERYFAEMKEKINWDYTNNLRVLTILKNIEDFNYLKYNNYKYNIGQVFEKREEEEEESRLDVIKVKDLILMKEDGVERNFLITQLVNNFGRKANDDSGEQENWYYCKANETTIFNETSIRLLPVFVYEMATEFLRMTPQEYQVFIISLIKKLKAKKSANNINWVDASGPNCTGWAIVNIGFVNEQELRNVENEDEDEDQGERERNNTRKDQLLEEEEEFLERSIEPIFSKEILEIVDALERNLKITLQINLKNFILNHVNTYKNNLMSKERYERKQQKLPYDDYIETNTLFVVVALFFIACQTSLKKMSFGDVKGCSKSLYGYPTYSDDVNTHEGIEFMACVLTTMLIPGQKYYQQIKRKKDDNKNFIMFVLADVAKNKGALIGMPSVKTRIERKKIQIANGELKRKETREENLSVKWDQFLPPLKQLTKSNNDITGESVQILISRLDSENFSNILPTMQKTIFRLSLFVQEIIQNIVLSESNNLIMKNYEGENYLSNNCCQAQLKDDSSVFNWFNEKSGKVIELNNNFAFLLENSIINAVQFVEATVLCSLFDTRFNFPKIQQAFSNKTMYAAFIYYFKFYQPGVTITNPEMLRLCDNRPEIEEGSIVDIKLTLEDKIKKLMNTDAYKNCVTPENLEKLLLIMSKKKTLPSFTSNDCNENTLEILRTEEPAKKDINSLLMDYLQEETHDKRKLKVLLDMIYNQSMNNKRVILDFLNKKTKKSATKYQVEDLDFVVLQPLNNDKEINVGSKVEVEKGDNKWYSGVISRVNLSDTYGVDYDKGDKDTAVAKFKIRRRTKDSNSLYTKVNFFKTLFNNMVSVYPEKMLNYKGENDEINLPPNFMKIMIPRRESLRDLILNERNDPLIKEDLIFSRGRDNKTKRILIGIKNSKKCIDIIKLSKSLPVFNEEAIAFLFEYFTLEIMVTYIEEYNNGEEENECYKEIRDLLIKYINICKNFGKNMEKKQEGITLSYEKISEMCYKAAEAEKNKIIKQIYDLDSDAREARDALQVTQARFNAYAQDFGEIVGNETNEQHDVVVQDDQELESGDEGVDLGDDGNNDD